MKTHDGVLATPQEQDLALRLQHAAQRRASDAARYQVPEHNCLLVPDVVTLLNAIFDNTTCHLETEIALASSHRQEKEQPDRSG